MLMISGERGCEQMWCEPFVVRMEKPSWVRIVFSSAKVTLMAVAGFISLAINFSFLLMCLFCSIFRTKSTIFVLI